MSLLPEHVKFMSSGDHFYPVEFQGVIYDSFNMRVVFDREKTGFEETKDFPIVIDSIIAGRYQVVEYLGSAAFSKAIQVYIYIYIYIYSAWTFIQGKWSA